MSSLDDEQGRQRVAAALERREAKAYGTAEDDAIAGAIALETQAEEPDRRSLHELLDEPDLQHAKEARAEYEPGLEHRRGQQADDPGGPERRHHAPRRKHRARIVVEVPDDGSDRHEEAAEQDNGREQDDVTGQERGAQRRDPERQSNEQDSPPARRPRLSPKASQRDLVGSQLFHRSASRSSA